MAALHEPGFEALLAFHYTVTAINELREPLHDEVVASVFRVEGNRLTPVKEDFEQVVLGSEFHPDQVLGHDGRIWFAPCVYIGCSTRKPWKRFCIARKAKCETMLEVGQPPH